MEEEVKIRITAPGSDDAAKGIDKVRTALENTQKALKDFSAHLREAGGQSGLLSVATDTLNQAITAMQSPLGMAAVGFMVWGEAISKTIQFVDGAVNRTQELFVEMRRMSSVTGDTIENSERFTNTMKLLGVQGHAVTMALTRLSIEIENGGDKLSKYGISIRNSSGELKTTLEIFKEFKGALETMTPSQRIAAEAQIFSARAARELTPALNASKEAWEGATVAAEKHAAMNKESFALAKEYQRALDENTQAWDKFSVSIASKIDVLIIKWTQFKTVLIDIGTAVVAGPGKALNWVADMAETRIGRLLSQLPVVHEALRLLGWMRGGKAAAPAAEEEPVKSKELTAGERKFSEMQIKEKFETNIRKLQYDAQYEAARVSLVEGSSAKALQVQIAMIEKEKEEEESRYRDILALGNHSTKELEKLKHEHTERMLKFDHDLAMRTLEMKRKEAEDERKVLDMSLKQQEAMHRAFNAARETEFAREKAALDTFVSDKGTKTAASYELAIRKANEDRDSTISAVNAKEAAERDFAAKFKDNFQIQMQLQSKLIEFGQQRADAEAKADRAIIQERQRMVQEMRNLANAEASIGESLEQKAISSLQARGKKRISQADIAEERARLGREAHETFAALQAGGSVDITKIGASREFGKQLAQMRELGTTPGQAAGMFGAQQAAAYGGREFNAIPSGMQQWAPRLQAIATQMKADADEAVERLTGTVKDTFQYFMDALIRKMEFEAARS